MPRRRLHRLSAAAFTVAALLPLAGAAPFNPPDDHKQPAKPAPAKAAPKANDAAKGSPTAPVVRREETPAEAHPAEPTTPSNGEAHDTEPEADVIDAQEALRLLKDGNARWVDGTTKNPNTSSSRREALAADGQKPFATILTCADSRLPVERLFDRGVGDLFVLRVAGNIVSEEEAGTVEYGAEHLHVPLLVVMGHTRCGAVAAAASGGHAPGNVGSLLSRISPAVDRARQMNPELQGAALAAAAVQENVWQSIFDLIRTSSTVRRGIATGDLQVVGAVCDIASGEVRWLGEHPWESALVSAFESRQGGEAAAPHGSPEEHGHAETAPHAEADDHR
jgi:carbonic anhydrase